jgi:predicted nucleic acid-binding protein
MSLGVILDTSFLITLAGEKRENHAAAVAYWKHFKESGIPIYLSTIVVSEFEVKQAIDDGMRLSCIPALFTWQDALRTSKLARLRKRAQEQAEGDDRVAVSDDIKIIAQAVERDVAYAITDDCDTFAKFALRWREEGHVNFVTLALRDGFDIGYFKKGGPDLLTKQGI